MIKINDKCRLLCDWIPPTVKQRRVQVIDIQKNGNLMFAKVRWLGGNAAENKEAYGNLFSFEELRKV